MKSLTPLFMKNIDAIREITKISQENFCGRILSWEEMKSTINDWDDLTTYKPKVKGQKKECIHVLAISVNTYSNYMNGKTCPPDADLTKMLSDINEFRSLHPVLKKCFRENITLEQLKYHDLLAEFNEDSSHASFLFAEKFFGNYLCYYNSTSLDSDDKKTQFGIIQLSKGSAENEFITNGIFSLKNEHLARKIFNSLQNGCQFQEALAGNELSVFTGISYLSPTLLWCNMSDAPKNEHLSMSFDLSSKITTKHPEKVFIGARGIALSQTSGQSSQTTTFPIVIINEPISVSRNELTKFLCFNYSRIPEEKLSDLAQRVVRLMTSLLQNNDIDESLRLKLISQIIEHEVKDLFSKHVFNSHYYLTQELTTFYRTIIRPIRQATEKSNADTRSDY